MLLSKFYLPLLKETPADAELVSHRYLLRAGMIRKLASGVYTWLPMGLRVLQKVEQIVRDEMNRAGALEFLFPSVQPAELWIESDRWEKYGKDLLRFKDRHDRDFCYGPTHEEVVVDAIRGGLNSYKQLPLMAYQIQTKFRDEIRPRFGLMRGREFIMKDAYSFNLDADSLQQSYDVMFNAYTKIFTRLGLNFRAVLADTGAIGGSYSHEFQVLADAGEDVVVYADGGEYAANLERAEGLVIKQEADAPTAALEKFATPDVKTIQDLADQYQCAPQQGVKTLIVKGEGESLVALILRGDHELNEVKAEHLDEVAAPLTFATEEVIREVIGAGPGSLGPVGLNITFIVDRDAAVLSDFVCGANEEGVHFKNVNWGRDVPLGKVADLRNVVEGEQSPDGKGVLKFARGIEVGHIFQLGDRYSKPMGLTVLNENGKAMTVQMGCYGLGVSRVVAAAIEQNHDEYGIIWPESMAPFQVMLIPLQMHKSYRVREVAELLYQQLVEAGIEVLMDDRKERPGAMFATADLIGAPHKIIISERGCDSGTVEYKSRRGGEAEHWSIDEVLERLDH